jgi:hypothetical protein
MTYRRIASTLAGLVAACLIGCTETGPTNTGESQTLTPEAGQFGLSWLKGLAKVGGTADTGTVETGAQVNFDLGQIKGSTSYYFLLYNIGRRPITDVTLSTNDTNFLVYPSHIDTLLPGGDIGMLPVVRITALHGTAIDGVGYRSLLPMGDNTPSLTVSGTTGSPRGGDTSVVLQAGLKVKALVMAVDVWVGCNHLNLRNPSTIFGGSVKLGGFEIVSMRGYAGTDSKWLRVRNGGNVAVAVACFYTDFSFAPNPPGYSDTLEIGDSLFVSRAGGAPYLCLRIGGDHTVSDYLSLPWQADGNVYFFMSSCQSCDTTCSYFAPFTTLAHAAPCADSANRLFLIDSAMVFWDRRGNCPDSAYSFTLYASTPDTILCRYEDSIAGPVAQCNDSTYHELLETMRTNLTDPNLGLDSTHTVAQIPL